MEVNPNPKISKEFIIKIKGRADSAEAPLFLPIDRIKTFDDFVNKLFKKVTKELKKEFDKEKELSYLKPTNQGTWEDPFMSRFEFYSVSKDVEA